MDSSPALAPITEDDIAQFLAHTPGFFERHAELLAGVRLAHPHGQHAVSLQQRQVDLLRRRLHELEHRAAGLLHHAQENVAIADRLQRWTEALLRSRADAALPGLIVDGLKTGFGLDRVELWLWGLADEFAALPMAQGGSEAQQACAAALARPYCGTSRGQECLDWLDQPGEQGSLALVPLRGDAATFGLLLLASPDPQRFQASMDTDFLRRLGELAGAALSRLLPPA